MPYSLTAWWTDLERETRKVALGYTDIDYPPDFIPNPDIEVSDIDTPWIAIHRMATLGAAIEANFGYKNIAMKAKINEAEKKLGAKLPDLPSYIPEITDERSLLLAIVYLRAQIRFKDIESTNSSIQNGAFGFSGINDNKANVAKVADALKKKIKDYCREHPESASNAHHKFISIFGIEDTTGIDLLTPKALKEQYLDFFNRSVDESLREISDGTFSGVYESISRKMGEIERTLAECKRELERLYLYKKMLEFIDKAVVHEEITLNLFLDSLNSDGHASDQRDELARTLWEEGAASAQSTTSLFIKATEWVNTTRLGFFAHAVSTFFPIINRVPEALGVDEATRLRSYKNSFKTPIIEKINIQSARLHVITQIKADDLQTATSAEIEGLIKVNYQLGLEINSLKKGLQKYIEEIKSDAIIQFSKMSFLGWFTEKLAQISWARPLLHDNIHYLNLAKQFENELTQLENTREFAQTDDITTQKTKINTLKEKIHRQVDEIHSGSRYLLFQQKRELARQNLKTLISDNDSELIPSLKK